MEEGKGEGGFGVSCFPILLIPSRKGRGNGRDMNIDSTGRKKLYNITLILERREILWLSGLGLMDLEELVEMSCERV
jgi:hypothetical protein